MNRYETINFDNYEKEYADFMKKAGPAYAKAKKLSKKETAAMVKEAKKYWKEVRKHV